MRGVLVPRGEQSQAQSQAQSQTQAQTPPESQPVSEPPSQSAASVVSGAAVNHLAEGPVSYEQMLFAVDRAVRLAVADDAAKSRLRHEQEVSDIQRRLDVLELNLMSPDDSASAVGAAQPVHPVEPVTRTPTIPEEMAFQDELLDRLRARCAALGATPVELMSAVSSQVGSQSQSHVQSQVQSAHGQSAQEPSAQVTGQSQVQSAHGQSPAQSQVNAFENSSDCTNDWRTRSQWEVHRDDLRPGSWWGRYQQVDSPPDQSQSQSHSQTRWSRGQASSSLSSAASPSFVSTGLTDWETISGMSPQPWRA
jgi:hypothetical protein